MSNEQDICPICDGVRDIEYTMTFRDARPYSMRVSDGVDKICYGHATPLTRHDGSLDEAGRIHVSRWCRRVGVPFRDESHAHYVTLRSLYSDPVAHIQLDPSQALSLLSWLQQEEAQLRAIVKEEQNNHD